MDPVAHTLFGAALGEAGLRRASRYATAALLIGANLPDIDIVAQFVDADTALYARRGWTHGVLAMAVLPLLLTAGLLLWQRGLDRWRGTAALRAALPPTRPGGLLLAACLGVWSHPLLDWLNTYGVRWLMPFDGRWFYGDTLFIVDPWLWLLLAAGVVVARSRRWPALLAFGALAVLASWLVLGRELPLAVKIAWCIGLAGIVALRGWLPPERALAVARLGLAGVLLHVLVAGGLARQAEARGAARFPAAEAVQANPQPGQPAAHRVIVAEAGRYHLVEPDGRIRTLPRAAPDPIVQRALADPSIRGFAHWTRFPWWRVEPHPQGWRVSFHDLRYSGPGHTGGIGHAEVVVPHESSGDAAAPPR
jgi:inner membrane protein